MTKGRSGSGEVPVIILMNRSVPAQDKYRGTADEGVQLLKAKLARKGHRDGLIITRLDLNVRRGVGMSAEVFDKRGLRISTIRDYHQVLAGRTVSAPGTILIRSRAEWLTFQVPASHSLLVHEKRKSSGAAILSRFSADGETLGVLCQRDVKAIAG